MYFNSNRDQHKRIAFGYSSSMLLHGSSDYGRMSVRLFKKPSFLDHLVKVALLYRSPNSTSSLFLENLMKWVNEKKPHILMDDYLTMCMFQIHFKEIKLQL